MAEVLRRNVIMTNTRAQWRDGRDKAHAILTIAQLGLLIGPVRLPEDAEFVTAWEQLTEADRRRLLASTEADQAAIDIACRLSGTSYEEAHKMVEGKVSQQQVIADLGDWRLARNIAGMVLASAHTAKMIGEMAPIADDREFCAAWAKLSEVDRRRILHFEKLDQDVLRVAAELAVRTKPDPHELADTPEARTRARQEMGL